MLALTRWGGCDGRNCPFAHVALNITLFKQYFFLYDSQNCAPPCLPQEVKHFNKNIHLMMSMRFHIWIFVMFAFDRASFPCSEFFVCHEFPKNDYWFGSVLYHGPQQMSYSETTLHHEFVHILWLVLAFPMLGLYGCPNEPDIRTPYFFSGAGCLWVHK